MSNPPRPPTPAALRDFRTGIGLSQAALAAALGVSTRGIEDWEAGRRDPPAYLALALAALDAGLDPVGEKRQDDLPILELEDYTLSSPQGRRITFTMPMAKFDALFRAKMIDNWFPPFRLGEHTFEFVAVEPTTSDVMSCTAALIR